MKLIEWTLNIGLVGEQSGEFEMPDDATEEEIESAVREAVQEYVDWGFNVKTI